ncbi:MAG: GTP-binding protein [Chloroflexota bacterium]|nr:GTP-binding protein [Chloroflexota bacterium]
MVEKKRKLSKNTLNKINIASQNLLENRATVDDIELLKKAVKTEQVTLRKNAFSSVIVIGEGNSVRLTSDQAKLLSGEKIKTWASLADQYTQDSFIGRKAEIKGIVDNIRSKTGSVNILFGMGGMGKTSLAQRVIWELRDEYSVFIKDFGNNPLILNTTMQEIIGFFAPQIDSQILTEPEIVQIYRQVIQREKPILFFDTVELMPQQEMKSLLENLIVDNAHIIIASREKLEIPGATLWKIGALQPEDSVTLLQHYSPNVETNQALGIADVLGHMPLALALIGAQLREEKVSAREYVAKLSDEILKNGNSNEVITYISRLASIRGIQSREVREAKLLFVGQGSVGKTSLINQIDSGYFNSAETITEGISITHLKIKPDITLNIWDFGGQEIMHATHQFFLTKRSLYLLVLDSRITQEENRAEYWLKIIQSFGGESPVLIVGNKIDQHPLDIDRTGLQKKYPNIVGILETSAATGTGIEELKAAIAEQVNNLPHVRDLLPETWFTVKTKLEGLGRESNFITHDKYLELCAENEVSDETSQRTLIGFLHDLGVVLHFQDDPRLEALGILNPQWVTNGVYKILNSHALFQNKGVLTVSMLDEILNLSEYPRGKRLFIVDMMKKFELCYDIEPDKSFLVPDLLPKDQPELNFNGIPAFEYAYPVLPSSVITRFIVRMNQHIDDGFVWRTGVLLRIGENIALVKADIEDRKITIAIDGQEHTRRDALSAIRYQLDEIHDSIKGLDAQKRVPIRNAPQAEPLKYEYLLKLERAGQETLLVENGNDLVTVNVRQMLSAIESESQRKETGGNVTNIYVGGNFDGNLTIGDSNQSIKDSYNKITSAKIDTELKETLKQLAEAVAFMAKSLPTEQAVEVTEDLSKLVDEATKPTPNKKWYSVSIEGLIKAAENVKKVGDPVINLSRKVLSLLTGGVVK